MVTPTKRTASPNPTERRDGIEPGTEPDDTEEALVYETPLRPSSPRPGTRPTVFLADDMTPVEAEVFEEWLRARSNGDGVEVVRTTSTDLETLALRTDDPLLTPVRAVWVSDPVVDTSGDLRALLGDPLRVGRRRQKKARRTNPSSCRIIAGEPATLDVLRERHDDCDGTSLATFIVRRAHLALERSERAILGSEFKVSRFVVEEITGSKRFRDGALRLARELGRTRSDVREHAVAALEEMIATQSRRATVVWSRLGRYFARAYRLDVDTTNLDEIRELGSRHSLVFLPSHRSYLDPLVLRPALTTHGLPLNHVMGGLNVGFWPIGPISKRSGTVFIRRRIGDDDVYKWALTEYMHYLVAKRFNLEWYIEGGRSRTGKLRPPRFGLLRYLSAALDDASPDSPDAYLVPVSITYDQLHEVGAMADEAHGAPKTPEGFRWLVGYVRAQGKRHGVAHVTFGRPLSFREYLGREDDRRLAVQKTAFEVSHRINAVTPITPASLVMYAFLGIEDRALTARELESILRPLVKYIRRRGLPTAGGVDLRDPAVVTDALRTHLDAGVLRTFDRGSEPVLHLAPGQHLVAAFHRNNSIHFFVTRAIAEMVVEAAVAGRSEDPIAAGWAEALRLRDVLKYEFFFGDKASFAADLRVELDAIDPDWEKHAGETSRGLEMLDAMSPYLAHRVLQPYLDAYAVVADELAREPVGGEVDRAAFVRRCLDAAEMSRLRQQIGSRESISTELFSTALQLADNRGLLGGDDADLADRRTAFAREMHAHVARVVRIRDLAHGRLDLVEEDGR